MRGLVISGSAIRPALTLQQVLANNLANSSVSGFRADRTAFHNLLTAQTGSLTEASGASLTMQVDETPGALETTGEPLHLALIGHGYFTVATEEGEKYTRSGDFFLGPDGTIQTYGGAELQTESGPIMVSSASQVVVESSGEVLVDGQSAGRLRLVQFKDPTSLSHAGGGLLSSDAEPEEASGLQVVQGRLEGSNVSPIHTMTEMITILRFLEANQKAFQAQDQSLDGLMRWAMQ
ncbi:MAG: flagellar hook-basal body complex protein [Candidatus Eisenbacteria bacterium]|uniref:Flagellar hook-basal body complex protein n=1 Tax=Eiseniibacteriota bacterium TaxID=2212470 RepID=A0A948W558_UNCEI|nr:flagellar hook-basal body complex protein [Candidatus Eisenbacteria bacterium]MBU1949320.1 flagellar hook-basal body complex protein [Candidatus Eisenbacteria bacterium]MBU2692947.1 flagellar hook-basal body complex protein [Candidatus Eisenbacteria bacterium]